jgi:flagellar motor switch protein FliM
MIEAPGSGEVLTRPELDALLAALAEERAEQERRAHAAPRLRRESATASRGAAPPPPALLRALEDFALQHGRRLSISHQRRVSAALISCDEVRAAELAETFLPQDRLVAFELSPDGPRGFLLLGRPLFFSLLTLACGARPGAPGAAVPRRPYTHIEERFLLRLSQEIVSELARAWGGLHPGPAQVRSVEPPERLREPADASFLLASFDVVGLGEQSRLRVVVPPGAFGAGPRDERAPLATRERDGLARLVLETRVELRVAIGSVRLPLGRLRRLRVGQVIPLERLDGDGLVVRVGGIVKFRAQRGAVGKVLAIEIQDRL